MRYFPSLLIFNINFYLFSTIKPWHFHRPSTDYDFLYNLSILDEERFSPLCTQISRGSFDRNFLLVPGFFCLCIGPGYGDPYMYRDRSLLVGLTCLHRLHKNNCHAVNPFTVCVEDRKRPSVSVCLLLFTKGNQCLCQCTKSEKNMQTNTCPSIPKRKKYLQ